MTVYKKFHCHGRDLIYFNVNQMLLVKPVMCDVQCLGLFLHNERLKLTLMFTSLIFSFTIEAEVEWTGSLYLDTVK